MTPLRVASKSRATACSASPRLLSAAMVVLIAWQAVQLTWAVLGANRAPETVPGAGAPQIVPAADGPRVDIAAIVGAHLFGAANHTPTSRNGGF